MFYLLLPPVDSLTINFYAEDRERFERHINPSFNGPADANRSDLYTRFRAGLAGSYGKKWTARIEYQNAQDLYWTHKKNSNTQDSDASLAYVDYKDSADEVTAGRQKILLNTERLIGATEWLNMARSFDAARFRSGAWDLWGGAIGVANIEPRTARVGALTRHDDRWGTASLILKHDVAPNGDIDLQTYDYYINRPYAGFALDGEAAYQTGNDNGKEQDAWAVHLRAKRTLLKKTTLSAEVNSASGGATGHVNRTFDNLYPTNHEIYGLADMTAWKNMDHVGLWLENQSVSKLSVKAGYHWLWLEDSQDAWYNATGAANKWSGGTFVDPSGKSGRYLGSEFDLVAGYKATKWATLSAGLALFDPGDFVRNVSGHADHQTFGYLQATFRLP